MTGAGGVGVGVGVATVVVATAATAEAGAADRQDTNTRVGWLREGHPTLFSVRMRT